MSSSKYDNDFTPQRLHESNAVLKHIVYFLPAMNLPGEFVSYSAFKYIIFSLLCFILLLK